VFAGTPERVADAAEGKDHEDLVGTIAGVDRGLLLPKTSLMHALLKRSKEPSGTVPRRGWQWAKRRAARQAYAQKA